MEVCLSHRWVSGHTVVSLLCSSSTLRIFAGKVDSYKDGEVSLANLLPRWNWVLGKSKCVSPQDVRAICAAFNGMVIMSVFQPGCLAMQMQPESVWTSLESKLSILVEKGTMAILNVISSCTSVL
jgi:hypothetical protein